MSKQFTSKIELDVRVGARRAPYLAPREPAVAPASTDSTAELKKLADLHASGVLTDEELAAAKKKVLGL
jgi:hypothetical protein